MLFACLILQLSRLVDDSGSMQAGKRLEEMNDNCEEVAFAASLFDTNGIEIRFFNSDDNGNVSSPALAFTSLFS